MFLCQLRGYNERAAMKYEKCDPGAVHARAVNNPWRTLKERGEWAEMQFMARAAAQGFTVTKPWGDSARYDFAVEWSGCFQRVQVKSTASRSGISYVCNVVRGGPDVRLRYTEKDLDFFAILLIPEELWYIIPVAGMGRERASYLLQPHNPKNRYFKYFEAWHLLKEECSGLAADRQSSRAPRSRLTQLAAGRRR
jgi:hypothetical protein